MKQNSNYTSKTLEPVSMKIKILEKPGEEEFSVSNLNMLKILRKKLLKPNS
jgi:hypothetical protein